MKPSNRQPTRETYSELDEAYSFFNLELFGGKLPPCVITLNRKKGAYGYFWGDTWTESQGKAVTDEIALNPDHFRTRKLADVLSTLVHEMCHLEQHHFGKPTRNGYHNKEWGGMMERVGLIPSDTGEEGGKKTGQQMTHYVQPAGPFDQACTELLDGGFKISWQARTLSGEAKKTKTRKAASKTKYTCPVCELNAWAKPGASLVCGDCNVPLDVAG